MKDGGGSESWDGGVHTALLRHLWTLETHFVASDISFLVGKLKRFCHDLAGFL